MNQRIRYSAEVRERAVRLVAEHERGYESQWAAIRSIAVIWAGGRRALGVEPSCLFKT